MKHVHLPTPEATALECVRGQVDWNQLALGQPSRDAHLFLDVLHGLDESSDESPVLHPWSDLCRKRQEPRAGVCCTNNHVSMNAQLNGRRKKKKKKGEGGREGETKKKKNFASGALLAASSTAGINHLHFLETQMHKHKVSSGCNGHFVGNVRVHEVVEVAAEHVMAAKNALSCRWKEA